VRLPVELRVRNLEIAINVDVYRRDYFSMQLITIFAVVKSKCAVEKGNVCTKKRRYSGQNYDLCADNQILCSYKSCSKYALVYRHTLREIS